MKTLHDIHNLPIPVDQALAESALHYARRHRLSSNTADSMLLSFCRQRAKYGLELYSRVKKHPAWREAVVRML